MCYAPRNIKMRKMWLFIAMLVVAFSSSAYASQIGETDVFGNVIDWEYDPNGLGEDSSTDADGNSTEEIEEPSLPEASVDYTPEEQAAVLQKMEENTNPEPTENGSMVASSSEDTDESQENCRVVAILRSDDAPDDNICVSLKNENGTCDITLTRSKSYTESVYLPAGTYTVESVSAADTDSTKAEYSAPSEIEVGADGTATIEITVAKRLIEDSALSEDSTGEAEVVAKKKSKFNVLKAVGAILIGAVAGVAGYTIARNKKKND
jgi:hypothetical protein